MLVSQREYAKQKGVSNVYIHKLVKQGRIPLEHGKINLEIADAALQANRENPPSATPKNGHFKPEPMAGTYLQARTFNETYKAKRAKLEYDIAVGKLIETDKVLEVTEQAFSNVRVRLRGLPKSLAAILAGNSRPAEVEKILADAIDMLWNL